MNLPTDTKSSSIVLKSGYNTLTFDPRKDISVSIDYSFFQSTSALGGGFCIFFIGNSLQQVISGTPGPGLGYAPRTDYVLNGVTTNPGVEGSYLAVAFDVDGYFALSGTGITGGTNNPVPNSITIRGGESDNYSFIDNSGSLNLYPNTNYPNTSTLQLSTLQDEYKTVRVNLLNFCKTVTVEFKNNKGEFVTYYTKDVNLTPPGSFVRAGLSYSTGVSGNNNFWIKNLNFRGVEGYATPTPTQTVTPTQTRTTTQTRTSTTTPNITQTQTPTRTRTQTPTQTRSSTPTQTRTNTQTSTRTRTQTPTQTPTQTLTSTQTRTKTPTPTATRTRTQTPTQTKTPDITPTRTRTPNVIVPTPTPTPTRTKTSVVTNVPGGYWIKLILDNPDTSCQLNVTNSAYYNTVFIGDEPGYSDGAMYGTGPVAPSIIAEETVVLSSRELGLVYVDPQFMANGSPYMDSIGFRVTFDDYGLVDETCQILRTLTFEISYRQIRDTISAQVNSGLHTGQPADPVIYTMSPS